jgi:hypothetical protein
MEQQAMLHAVEALRTPSRYRKVVTNDLPIGMLAVIKIAAGDEKLLAENAQIYRLPSEQVQEAAKHFLLRVLLDPESHGLRLLGLNEGASEGEIKDHKRWLLKWLHPDRNPSKWEQALFHRVNAIKIETKELSRLPAAQKKKSDQRNSRRHIRQRMWTPVDNRRKDTSTRRLLFRLSKPLLASTAFVVTIIWLYSMRDSLHYDPLKILAKLVNI